MELINTKDLYENDAFVIIEAEFEDSETKKRMQEISLATKLTSSAAGFQLSEVKSPSCNDPATVQLFAALTKTFCT